MLALLVYLSMTGKIRWSREFEQSAKDAVDLRKDYDRQLTELRQQLEQMRADRDRWEDKAWASMERWTGDLERGSAVVAGVTGRVIGRGGH